MKLLISEEYGYRHWLATLTNDEYDTLIARWNTMSGLNCLVPITLIIPQAKELTDEEYFDNKLTYDNYCHIHECDDSSLDGTDYKIPYTKEFCIDGRTYTETEIFDELDAIRKANPR